MDRRIDLKGLLSAQDQDRGGGLTVFALINLGLIESLANGSMGASEAVDRFYFADNCLFVRKAVKDKTADQIMGRGVQLPDLFDSLPPEEALREFLRELSIMKRLCQQLLDDKKRVA